MSKVGLQKSYGIRRDKRVRREKGIREYAHESSLCERASRPGFFSVAPKPFLDLFMSAVGRPSHCNKNIDVQQENGLHYRSSWSFLTSSLPTVGEPGGNSTT